MKESLRLLIDVEMVKIVGFPVHVIFYLFFFLLVLKVNLTNISFPLVLQWFCVLVISD